MKCNVIKLNEDDQFISKIKNGDSQIARFYEYDASLRDSFSKRLNTPNNGREEQLSSVIKSYMSDLDLSESQIMNIKDLAEGAKVVIGGQQAGLFGGPLYTFHKIFSIITLSNQLTNQYNEKLFPFLDCWKTMILMKLIILLYLIIRRQRSIRLNIIR